MMYVLAACGGLLVAGLVSLYERRRLKKKLTAQTAEFQQRMEKEQEEALQRMGHEFNRQMNEMHRVKEAELQAVATRQTARAMIDQQPIHINMFDYGQTNWMN